MRKKCVFPTAFALIIFLILFYPASCSRNTISQNGTAVEANETLASVNPAGTVWHTLAHLKTGENPIWFELGPEGPSLIDSPALATLKPFTPWPHARHIIGRQMWEGFLVMAVNREGFLILGAGSEPKELIFYRTTDSAFWDPLTAESFFSWENQPAVLLYRNDFFSGLSAPPLVSQVFVLSKSSPVPLPARIPAFEGLPLHWEAEVLRRAPDGFWYYRVREKGRAQNETIYFRTEDLTIKGTSISFEEWRESDQRGQDIFDSNRYIEIFSLPVLPEGFIYSGVTVFGNVIAASWEEQQDAAIGAAGFMVMALY